MKKDLKKFVIISGSGNTIAWFRLEMLKSFIDNSFEVYALAPDISNQSLELLKEANIHFIKINLVRKSLNVFDLFRSIHHIFTILNKIKPNIVFSYTHKAIIASSFASFLTQNKILSIAMISGIGHIFNDKTKIEKIKKFFGLLALKLSLKLNQLVFFQNPDDKNLFLSLGLLDESKARVVNGSGVNLEKFPQAILPNAPIFLTMSRLLKSKGLIEFAHAAKTVKSLHPDARFLLYGYPDDHEDSIAESEIKDSWLEKYGVEYMGFSKNPSAAIASSSIFVLLSYNEGTPRSVLEAMSMGRPIITTEARGCRETVNGKNGFLVPVGDHQQVSKRMIELLNSELRKKMGDESRKYCARKFDVRLVNKSILAEVLNLNK